MQQIKSQCRQASISEQAHESCDPEDTIKIAVSQAVCLQTLVYLEEPPTLSLPNLCSGY